MISIALATYNGEKYLREQLDSILAQTVTDWELVVCDDCSKDNTVQILKEYAKSDNRIRFFTNEKNLGFTKNFEKVVSLCNGDYIACCDQDDRWHEDHLRKLVENLSAKSGSVANAQIMNSESALSGKFLSDGDGYFVDGNEKDKLFRILFYGNPFQGTSSLYTKGVMQKALPVPEGIDFHDAWFSACACCFNGLNYTFEPITNYRIHGKNASGSHDTTFFERLKITLKRKGFKTDRLIFCEELLKRFPDMEKGIKDVVLKAKDFHTSRQNGRRLKVVSYTIKYYKKIYATNTVKLLVPRCLGILIKG